MVKKAEYLHHERCQPLPYYGGKQKNGKAKWIAGLLPWRKDSFYCEPFGGMASVLVTRAEVKTEMYNDLDGRIVNWWRVLRDQTDRFCRDVEGMPRARAEYERALTTLNDPAALDYDRALAVQVVLGQSIGSSLNGTGWSASKTGNKRGAVWPSERVRILADRILRVRLECRPAVPVLKWMQDTAHAVIYCDPPYYTADNSAYIERIKDVGALSQALLAQAGKVAISGYGDEWEHLGWKRHEKDVSFSGFGPRMQGKSTRTEVLWTNYDADVEGAAANAVAGEA